MHKEAYLTANEIVNAMYNLEKWQYSEKKKKSEYKGPKQLSVAKSSVVA